MRVLSDGDDAAAGQGGGAGTQDASDSVGSAQVGSVDANAPVRVASDGDNSAGGGNGGGPQATGDSAGAAQVGSAGARAPVRVLSDGDDAAPGGGGGGPQEATGSSGSAQVGSPGVTAPVRALSDGDTTTTGGSAGSQGVDGSTGTAQVGSPQAYLPIRVASEGLPGGGGNDVQASPSGVAPVSGGDGGPGSPSAEELRRLIDGSDPDPALSARIERGRRRRRRGPVRDARRLGVEPAADGLRPARAARVRVLAARGGRVRAAPRARRQARLTCP